MADRRLFLQTLGANHLLNLIEHGVSVFEHEVQIGTDQHTATILDLLQTTSVIVTYAQIFLSGDQIRNLDRLHRFSSS